MDNTESLHKLVDGWLKQIGEVIGVKLELRSDGHAELVCNEQTTVTIEVDAKRGYVYFTLK